MSRLAHFLADHHIWISAGAMASAWQTAHILQLPPLSPVLAAFLFFGTLAGYSFLSLMVKSEAGETLNSRFLRPSLRLFLLLAGIVGTALLLPQLPRSGQFWSMAGAVLTFAYGLPVAPEGKALRDLPFLKIFLISVTWAAAIVILPWSVGSDALAPFPWLLFLGKLCFIFALTLPFDLRDAEVDHRSGVLTLPIALGWPMCRALGLGALNLGLILVCAPLLAESRLTEIAPEAIAFLLAAFGLLVIKPDHPKLLFTLGLDGLLLLPACLGLLIR